MLLVADIDRSLCVMGRSLSVPSSPFEMVEMDKIVSGKRGWVTRASTEYARKGDRPSEPAIGSSIDKAVNLYNTAIRRIMRD